MRAAMGVEVDVLCQMMDGFLVPMQCKPFIVCRASVRIGTNQFNMPAAQIYKHKHAESRHPPPSSVLSRLCLMRKPQLEIQ